MQQIHTQRLINSNYNSVLSLMFHIHIFKTLKMHKNIHVQPTEGFELNGSIQFLKQFLYSSRLSA